MTDNEILKALECCSNDNVDCEECPANSYCESDIFCVSGAILDLINRQKAEVERLKKGNKELVTESDARDIENYEIAHRVRVETIKEFAERLKNNMCKVPMSPSYVEMIINNVAKELTEQKNDFKE